MIFLVMEKSFPIKYTPHFNGQRWLASKSIEHYLNVDLILMHGSYPALVCVTSRDKIIETANAELFTLMK